jgi:large subunit ribosomal protein L3
MYRVSHAGQTGYHQRTQYNNMILKIGESPADVNPKGGIPRYGLLKGQYVLVKGSLQGPNKRLLTLIKSIRLYVKRSLPTIESISTASVQGR